MDGLLFIKRLCVRAGRAYTQECRHGPARLTGTAVAALLTLAVAADAQANHQDLYFDSNGDGVVTAGPPDTFVDSDGDLTPNRDDACPYDSRPSDYSATPANPTGENNPAKCSAFEDKDRDGYITAQDPCDNAADNAACDRDGDGEPDSMDDCPFLATGHMLGIPTVSSTLPLKSCHQPPETSIGSYIDAWGTQGLIGNALILGVEPQTFDKRRNIKAGLPIDIRCSVPCEVTVTVTLRTGELGAEANATLPSGGGTVKLRFNENAKREFKRRAALSGTVSYSGASSGAHLDSASGPTQKLLVNEDGTSLSSPRPRAEQRQGFGAGSDSLVAAYELAPLEAVPAATKFGGIAGEVATARGCASGQITAITPFTVVTGPPQEVDRLTYGSPKRCAAPEQLAVFARTIYDAALSGGSVRLSFAVRALARTRGVLVCHHFYGVNDAWVANVQVNPPSKTGGCL